MAVYNTIERLMRNSLQLVALREKQLGVGAAVEAGVTVEGTVATAVGDTRGLNTEVLENMFFDNLIRNLS